MYAKLKYKGSTDSIGMYGHGRHPDYSSFRDVIKSNYPANQHFCLFASLTLTDERSEEKDDWSLEQPINTEHWCK